MPGSPSSCFCGLLAFPLLGANLAELGSVHTTVRMGWEGLYLQRSHQHTGCRAWASCSNALL